MQKLAGAALLWLIAVPAWPQQTLVETIEVRIANIDVVVRDRAGNPVVGLSKNDFELDEDGVPQPITNFYEVRRGEETDAAGQSEVPLELRQRRIVLFVDSTSLTPSRRTALLDSVRKFIDTRLRAEDQAMLVSWHAAIHVVTPFTNDKTALKHGLEAIARFGPAGEASPDAITNIRRHIENLYELARTEENQPRSLLSWDEAYEQSRTLVSRYTQQLLSQQQLLIEAIHHVGASMAGLEGKKILLFVGEHFPEHPGAELFRYVDDLFFPHLNRNVPLNLEVLTGIAGDTTAAGIEQLATDAAANGVTIYAIGAAAGDNESSAENNGQRDYGYSFTRDANTASALETIANTTGGVAITRTSNFDLAFDTITRDLASYYSLGYKPTGEGMQHKIVVRTKHREFSVRSRRSFLTKSNDDQMTDRVIANLYTDPSASAWPISIRTGPPRRDGRKFLIPVQVVMTPAITLMPRDQGLVGGFILYFVVGTIDGQTSEVMRRPQGLKVPPNAEAAVRAKPMTFTTAIRVNPGESILSVAIFDQLSGTTGFARTKIAAR